MFMTLLSYLPIPLAPVAAVALVVLLQHLLRLRRPAAPTAPSTALVPATANSPPEFTWSMVTQRWNPFITGVLPILTSIAIVLLILWPCAYLGSVVLRFGQSSPGWDQQVPPWFGNLGYFVGFGAIGLMVAVLVALRSASSALASTPWANACCGRRSATSAPARTAAPIAIRTTAAT